MMSKGDKMGFDVGKCTKGPEMSQKNKGSSWEHQKFCQSLLHTHLSLLTIIAFISFQVGLKPRTNVVSCDFTSIGAKFHFHAYLNQFFPIMSSAFDSLGSVVTFTIKYIID